MNSVAVFPSLSGGFYLRWQGVEVGQHKAGEFMSLSGLCLGKPVDFMQSVVSNASQTVSPLFKRWRQRSFFGELLYAFIQRQPSVLWCDFFGGNFQGAAIHRGGGLPVLTPYGPLGLDECSADRIGAVSWGGFWFWGREKFFLLVIVQMKSQLTLQACWAFVILQGHDGRDRVIACVAGEKDRPMAIKSWRFGCGLIAETAIRSSAVRAIVGEGYSHA